MLRVLCLLVVLALAAAAPAAAQPLVVAQSAGPLRLGVARHAEDSLPALRAAAGLGAVVGLDAALTADRVPVAFPAPVLDGRTSCAGPLAALTAAALAALDTGCPLLAPSGAPPAEIPTLHRALAEARDLGATVLLTVGPDAAPDAHAILAAVPPDLPPARLIVRSPERGVLTTARRMLPGVQTATEGPAPDARAPWLVLAAPVAPELVAGAQAAGRRVLVEGVGAVEATDLAADAMLTPDPAAALVALGQVLPAEVAPAPSALPELLLPALASDGASGPRVALGWRAPSAEATVEVRPRGSSREGDWRLLVKSGTQRAAAFTGAPGEAYRVRVSADGVIAEGGFAVPYDDSAARGPGWRRVREPGAWGGRVAVARRAGARLRLRFRGERLRVVAPRAPEAGRLAVTLDRRRFEVSLAGPPAARATVWASPPLRPGRHVATLRSRGGGRVAVDALATG